MAEYSASKSLPPGRKVWIVSFRHPARKDPKGKYGLKVKRSLGTENEAEATRLVAQLDQLLGDTRLHSLSKRREADRRFDAIVVSAFYDPMEGAVVDDATAIREAKVPLPKNGVPKVLLVGATGSGKTSLLRHLIGSDPKKDRFPSTSTARTTTCDIEVLACREDTSFKAVVTFHSKWETTTSVAECVANACLASLYELPEDKIADRLLHHPDQVFRLSYVLGPFIATDKANDEWAYEGENDTELGEDEVPESAVPSEQQAKLRAVLGGFVSRIHELAEVAKAKTEADLGIKFASLKPADIDIAEEYFADIIEDQPEFDKLVDDILAEVLLRFEQLPPGDRTNKQNGWPEGWACECNASAREDFMSRIRWFSSNYAPAFGRLVTPLVQGIRVRGPFVPNFTEESSDLILIDGQGFGHTPDSTASVSIQVTKRYGDVDAILLVDNAMQSMLGGSVSILRSVLTSGYQRKLAIAFTHADQVSGPNLPDFASRRAHVLRAASGALTTLREALGPTLVDEFERDLDRRSFMLGWLDKPITTKSRGAAREMVNLLTFCQDSMLPDIPTDAVAAYEPTGLLFAAQSADGQFQELWKARLGFITLASIQKKHWATVKALNKRVALSIDNGEYSDLRPVAELLARLSESISRFLEKPAAWHGPSDPEQRQVFLDRVRRGVFAALHTFIAERLLSDRLPEWVRGFELAGSGSTSVRAQVIREIVVGAAPVPTETMGREVTAFLTQLRNIVFAAIRESGGLLVSDEAQLQVLISA
jgi:energy-coupling factor transporter ATP-binding protein EcfA2